MDQRPAVKEPSCDKYQASWQYSKSYRTSIRIPLCSQTPQGNVPYLKGKVGCKAQKEVHTPKAAAIHNPLHCRTGLQILLLAQPFFFSHLILLNCVENAHRSQVTWTQQVTIPTLGSKSRRKKLKYNSSDSNWILNSFSFPSYFIQSIQKGGRKSQIIDLSHKFTEGLDSLLTL